MCLSNGCPPPSYRFDVRQPAPAHLGAGDAGLETGQDQFLCNILLECPMTHNNVSLIGQIRTAIGRPSGEGADHLPGVVVLMAAEEFIFCGLRRNGIEDAQEFGRFTESSASDSMPDLLFFNRRFTSASGRPWRMVTRLWFSRASETPKQQRGMWSETILAFSDILGGVVGMARCRRDSLGRLRQDPAREPQGKRFGHGRFGITCAD